MLHQIYDIFYFESGVLRLTYVTDMAYVPKIGASGGATEVVSGYFILFICLHKTKPRYGGFDWILKKYWLNDTEEIKMARKTFQALIIFSNQFILNIFFWRQVCIYILLTYVFHKNIHQSMYLVL